MMRANKPFSRLSLCGVIFLFLITAVLINSQDAEAKVYGPCANCHTMHNSQDGAGMVSVRGEESAGALGDCAGCHVEPRDNLLTLSCVACHAYDLTPGPSLRTAEFSGFPVPQVVYQQTDSLAAGNFYYVFNGVGGDVYGHNVHGFGGVASGGVIKADVNIPPADQPPGYVKAMDWSTAYTTALGYKEGPVFGQPGQPMCAGTFGCHGNRDVISQTMAIQGSHHANDSMLKFGTIDTAQQGTTSGTSYRFLSGVLGGEDDDWEDTVSESDHNEYMGAVIGNRTTQTAADIDTMSEFCAGCHGNFHMQGGGAGTGLGSPSPWIRHPSDVLIPSTAPYTVYNTYNPTTPVARTVIPNSPASGTGLGALGGSGSPIVFCLSCHRAHASEEIDALRFSYSLMETGSGGGVAGDGCFACHSDK